MQYHSSGSPQFPSLGFGFCFPPRSPTIPHVNGTPTEEASCCGGIRVFDADTVFDAGSEMGGISREVHHEHDVAEPLYTPREGMWKHFYCPQIQTKFH